MTARADQSYMAVHRPMVRALIAPRPDPTPVEQAETVLDEQRAGLSAAIERLETVLRDLRIAAPESALETSSLIALRRTCAAVGERVELVENATVGLRRAINSSDPKPPPRKRSA